MYLCISEKLQKILFLSRPSRARAGGTFGAVCGPRLRRDAYVVIESTPNVCFYFVNLVLFVIVLCVVVFVLVDVLFYVVFSVIVSVYMLFIDFLIV